MRKRNKIILFVLSLIVLGVGGFVVFLLANGLTFYEIALIAAPQKREQYYYNQYDHSAAVPKPVIYLYPEKETDVLVQLDFVDEITLFADYPDYDKKIRGWNVTATPDGQLFNHRDGKEYKYLFWEGKTTFRDWDLSQGFVVRGEDTKKFLEEKLAYLGLIPEEYNDFIVYWYPEMQENKYNLIHFAGEQYTDMVPLSVTPTPDSVLRVFMVYKPLNEKISVPEQKLTTFERKGFSVVEWGGFEVK